MASLIYGAFLAVIAGVLWGSAFGASLRGSILWSAIVGVLVSLLIHFFGNLVKSGRNLSSGETSFVNNSILTAAGILAIVSGVIALGVSFMF